MQFNPRYSLTPRNFHPENKAVYRAVRRGCPGSAGNGGSDNRQHRGKIRLCFISAPAFLTAAPSVRHKQSAVKHRAVSPVPFPVGRGVG